MARNTYVFWREVSCQELLSLIENTIDETVVQRATVTIGFSQLLKTTHLSKQAKESYTQMITEKSVQSAYDARALQKAIRLQEQHEQLPILKHGTKEIISLESLAPRTHFKKLTA